MKQIQTGQLTCSKTGQVYLLLTDVSILVHYVSLHVVYYVAMNSQA